MTRTLHFLLYSAAIAFYAALASSAFAGPYTTNAIADVFVATGPTGNLGNNNYGGGGALAVAASGLPNGEFQSVIKFDLTGARDAFDAQYGVGQWSVESVSLQLSSSPHNNAIYNNVAAGVFGVSLMGNNSWTEGTGTAGIPTGDGVTFNTLQSTFISGAADQGLGTFAFDGSTSGAHGYSLTLSPGLSADVLAGDDASLRLFAADNSVSYLFSSRSSASSAPELIVTAVPEPSCLALVALALGSVWLKRWQ